MTTRQTLGLTGAAAATALFLVVSAPSASAGAGAAAGPSVTPTPAEGCVAEYTKAAGPDLVLLGETVDITLTVKATCFARGISLHVVLVLDGSNSMAGQPSRAMKSAAERLVRRLDMETYPSTQVGIVEFDSVAGTRCRLTNDTDRALGCVDRVQASGGTAIDRGIQEGWKVLRQGRSGLDMDRITEVMVLFSDGRNDAGCGPVLNAARKVRGQGVLTIAVCVGADCDEACMRQVASSPRYYFRVENVSDLWSIFDQIRDRPINVAVRLLEVKDVLPANMAYVPDSAVPAQAEPAQPVDYLLWRDTYVPREGVTYTFRVRPLQAGRWPSNLNATGRMVDNRGRVTTWTFDSPWVTVLRPDALPTLPTYTPRPTRTATATATRAPRPAQACLPVLLTR
jgi:uncharacterized protein YegL